MGAWAAIICDGKNAAEIFGTEENTTHNRMELQAVLKALEYIQKHGKHHRGVLVFTDSQYVCGLPARQEKLRNKSFKTKRGSDIQNIELVKALYQLTETREVTFIKVKAHQGSTSVAGMYNTKVDMLSRKLVREMAFSKDISQCCA